DDALDKADEFLEFKQLEFKQ
nr:hypothetical protein [Tanacetum cinerariifolium]